ncbi:hypothetical protein CPC08DRAFT_771077 [Agrocybe pediades]|nr:hypothetical protein CPC08DRAFT_771077 [Agrocybe pediades]
MAAKKSDKQEIVIVIIGRTGAGKSHFANLATGGQNAGAVRKGLSSSIAPPNILLLTQPVIGIDIPVYIVDTRGFDGTGSSNADKDVWAGITSRLVAIRAENPKRLFGAIYLTSLQSGRVLEADKKNLKTFLLLYGTNFHRKVVLASNWGTKEQHDELVRLHPWNIITGNGGQDARFCGDRKSALDIVEKVVRLIMADQQGFEFDEKSIAKKLKGLGSSEQKEYKKRQSGLQRFFSMLRCWE